jgi:hypothetical protein
MWKQWLIFPVRINNFWSLRVSYYNNINSSHINFSPLAQKTDKYKSIYFPITSMYECLYIVTISIIRSRNIIFEPHVKGRMKPIILHWIHQLFKLCELTPASQIESLMNLTIVKKMTFGACQQRISSRTDKSSWIDWSDTVVDL